MSESDILKILKMDLQISTAAFDDFLRNIVGLAAAAVKKEGITLTDNIEDGMLVEMYAAYLYRKRRENIPMPRALRWQLNNRLFSQKAGKNG